MKPFLTALLILICLLVNGCSYLGLPSTSTLTTVTGSLNLGVTQEEAIVPVPPDPGGPSGYTHQNDQRNCFTRWIDSLNPEFQ
jgi:hypothetical protein